MATEEARIKIIAEAVTNAAVQGLETLIRIEKELIRTTETIAQKQEKTNVAHREATGIVEKLEKKLRDLKTARDRAEDVDSVHKYNAAISKTSAELDELTKGTNNLNQSTSNQEKIFKSLGTALVGLFAVSKIMEYTKSTIGLAIETDRMHLALKNVTSSAEEYQQSLTFLNKISNEYGQNVNVLTKSYTSFIASSNSSNLSMEERQRIFASVIKAGSALALSNDAIEGSLRAMSQMFSKGNVQAEELRGQLGERLPGAFDLAAKAMGVSTKELNKMLEKGEVLASDLLPKLATELENLYSDKAKANIETIPGAWNRISNAFIKYISDANEAGGVTKKIAGYINSLADNLESIITVVARTVSGLKWYAGAVVAIVAAQTAWSLIQKIQLVIQGQVLLAQTALTGQTVAYTAAQTAAITAATKFNAVMSKNIFGVVTLAIGALIAAYQYFKYEAEKAIEKQNEFNKGMADAKAPLIRQQAEFNNLAKAVLNGTLSYEEQIRTLNRLKEKHPDILKGVMSLEEAERKLNTAGILVNSQNDYRLSKLDELKKRYPDQLKGIDNLKDAEAKLGGVMVVVNGEYLKRIELASLAYKAELQGAKVNELIKERVLLEERLAKASSETTFRIGGGGTVGGFTGKQEVTGKSEKDDINYLLKENNLLLQVGMREMEKYQSKSTEITKTLSKNFNVQVKDAEEASARTIKAINKSAKNLENDAKKKIAAYGDYADRIIKIEESLGRELTLEETKKMASILNEQEKGREKMMADFDKSQRKYLASIIKGNNEEEKINKDLYEAQKKALVIQNDAYLDFNFLRTASNAKTLKELESAEKDYNTNKLKEQQRQANIRILEVQAEIKKLETIERIEKIDTTKRRTDLYKELEALQNKYNEITVKLKKEEILDSITLEEEKQKLIVESALKGIDVRLLAKKQFNKDIDELNKEELDKLKILAGDLELTEKEHRERRKIAKKLFKKEYSELTAQEMEEVAAKTEDGLSNIEKWWRQHRVRIFEIANAAYEILGTIIDLKMQDANTATEKALLENAKMWADWGMQALNVVDTFLTNGVVSGIIAAVVWVVKGIANIFTASKRKAKAEMQDLLDYYKENLYVFRDFIAGVEKDIESVFGKFINKPLLPIDADSIQQWVEAWKEMGLSSEFLVSKMLEVGKAIEDNYQKEIKATTDARDLKLSVIDETFKKETDAENKLNAEKIKNINDVYNLAISKINAEYDARAEREAQRYGQETLAIKENLSLQLGLLLENEESKTSILAEYNAKRSAILTATALADMQIVEGMDKATIDAINAARELRDKQLSSLQDWLNQELTWTIENEGQKRKEYTATQQLQKDAQEELDLLAIEYSVKEIERKKDKDKEILGAEQVKLDALEAQRIAHDAKIELLEKNHADAKILIDKWYNDESLRLGQEKDAAMLASFIALRDAVTSGYSGMIAMADEALAKGAITIEEYTKLLNLLEGIKYTMGDDAFKFKAPEKSPYWDGGGVQYFSEGAEYVPLGRNKKGIDTIPSLLTEGERVLTTRDNMKLGGMSNDELVRRALNPIQIPSLDFSPNVKSNLQEMEAVKYLLNMNMQPLIKEMEETREAISNIPIQNFTLDQNGLSKFVKKGNSTIKYNNKRYKA